MTKRQLPTIESSPTSYRPDENALEDGVKIFEGILSDQAVFLAPLADTLAAHWAKLYLTTFGRGSFFSAQRVQRIFKDLTDSFITCLQARNLDAYYENLKEHGKSFAKLGVPFEEVIISIHLFEETCLEHFLESFPQKTRLIDCVLALEELHNQGLAALASSYFESAKLEIQNQSDSLREENEGLRKELDAAKTSIFSITQKELSSMQLLISGINQKLRNRVYQLSRVQKIFDALDAEPHLPKLLRLASLQLLATCPVNSCVYFGFFNEDRKKIDLYHQESRESIECDLVSSFYFSELPAVFQEGLYDESKKISHFESLSDIPQPITDRLTLRNQREFILLPIRKYREVMGFVLLGTATENFFSKNNYRFYQRLGQVISRAIATAILFNRCKKQERFSLLMEETRPGLLSDRPAETTLDLCLGSLIELLGAERSSFMRFNEDKKELKVCAAKGYRVYPFSGVSIKWGEGIAGLALKESKPIMISRMRPKDEPHLLKRLLSQKDTDPVQIKSLLCVPIFDLEKPLGVVNISTINFHREFDKSDIEMASHVANRIAGILTQMPDTP